MKWLVYTLLIIAGAAGLTLLASKDKGYVLINVAGWTLESSLISWIVVLVLAFIFFYWFIRLYVKMWRLLPEMKLWQDNRRKERATRYLLDGLVKLAEGDWASAEKVLVKYAGNSSEPMLNYLSAARAAHEQNQFDRRDRYINLAGQHADQSDVAVKLILAEFQHNEQLEEQALATLKVLQQMNPRHRTVVKTLASLYYDMRQWEAFLSLVPQLRKQRVFRAEDIDHWEQQAYIQLLSNNQLDGKALEALWYRIPQTVQAQQSVLVCYIHQLLSLGRSDVTESLIRNALKRNWNNELARLYGIIDGADARAQLTHAETWLKNQEHNPVLLLTLGRLSLKNQLWGKARSYFEASIGADGPAEAYNELAQLLEKLGEFDKAIDYYKEGLRKTPQCESAVASKVNPVDLDQPVESSQAVINAR